MIMKKIYGVVALMAMLMGGTLLPERTVKVAAAAPTGIKNVVLVHGAFADGSGWEAVAKILEKDGYAVSVAQPPETSYADDQKYTKAAIDAMGGPVVLVGSQEAVGSNPPRRANFEVFNNLKDFRAFGPHRRVHVLSICDCLSR
jgi:hypothetical protein